MTLRLVGGTDMEKRRASESAFNIHVGGIIMARRVAQDVSRETLAKLVDKDASQIARYERGETPLTCVLAFRMCKILGIDMGELFK